MPIGAIGSFIAILCTFFVPVQAYSKEIYVSPSGVDSNSQFYVGDYNSAQNAEKHPLQTVRQALTLAQPGDNIYLRTGTYTETITITKSGSEAQGRITIGSYPGESAIFTRKDSVYRKSSIYGKGVSYITIANLAFDDCYYDVIYFEGPGEHIAVIGNTIRNQNAHVPDAPPPAHRAGHAIRLKGFQDAPISHVTITDNLLEGNHTGHPRAYDEALTVMGSVNDVTIARNRVIDNDFIGIDLIGKTKGSLKNIGLPRNVTISDNYVQGNGKRHEWAAGIYVDGADKVTIEGNRVINNIGPGIAISQEQQDDIVTNVTVKNNILTANKYNLLVGPSMSDSSGGTLVNAAIIGNTMSDARELGEILIMDAYDVSFRLNRFSVGEHGVLARFYSPDIEKRAIKFADNCLISGTTPDQAHLFLERIFNGLFKIVPNDKIPAIFAKCE